VYDTLSHKFWLGKVTDLYVSSILEDFTSSTSYLGFSFADLKKDGSWLVEVGYFTGFL